MTEPGAAPPKILHETTLDRFGHGTLAASEFHLDDGKRLIVWGYPLQDEAREIVQKILCLPDFAGETEWVVYWRNHEWSVRPNRDAAGSPYSAMGLLFLLGEPSPPPPALDIPRLRVSYISRHWYDPDALAATIQKPNEPHPVCVSTEPIYKDAKMRHGTMAHWMLQCEKLLGAGDYEVPLSVIAQVPCNGSKKVQVQISGRADYISSSPGTIVDLKATSVIEDNNWITESRKRQVQLYAYLANLCGRDVRRGYLLLAPTPTAEHDVIFREVDVSMTTLLEISTYLKKSLLPRVAKNL